MVPMYPAFLLVLMNYLCSSLRSPTACVRARWAPSLLPTQGLPFSDSHSASPWSSLAAAPDLRDLSISVKLFEHHLFSVYTHSCDLVQPHDLLNTTYVPI